MQISENSKQRMMVTAGVVLVAALAAGSAMAGSGGDEFSTVYDTLVEWTQGTLGRIISIAMILVGLVAGVVRQSIMALVVGLAGGMGLYNAPTVIEAVMTATAAHSQAIMMVGMSNGLL